MKIKMRQMVVGAALMGAAAAGSALAASAITGDTTPSTESSAPATDVPTTDGVINLDPGTGSSGTAGTAGTPACPAPGDQGPRGPKHEELTGTTADKVTAAAQAAVPGGEVLRVEGKAADDTNADETAYHAHVRKADGTHVRVNINADFTVKDIVEGKGPGGPRGPEGGRHGGHHGGRHGDGHGPCAPAPRGPAQPGADSNSTADNGATGSVTAVESSTQV